MKIIKDTLTSESQIMYKSQSIKNTRYIVTIISVNIIMVFGPALTINILKIKEQE